MGRYLAIGALLVGLNVVVGVLLVQWRTLQNIGGF
jgi:hypothetical protein